MSSIDKRIVQMKFDNAQFERGISQTMQSLNGLEKSINSMSGARNFTGLQEAIDNINNKFSFMGTVADQVIRRITDQIFNLSTAMAKQFTVTPVLEGFNTYEQKINATQQIMNSASVSQEIALSYLKDLNKYSDLTIYRLSDMTQSLGKFTAAGVELDKAATAIKGLGNVAAVSGASTMDFSRAIYNVSQTLGMGHMLARDWMSIENANMATKEFKEQLISVAKEIGTLNKEGKVVNPLQKFDEEVTFKNVRDSLSSGWLTSDVLIGTLEKYADTTNEIGNKAFEAATRVKTFHQLLETMGDSIGTAWSRVFSSIIGDYEDAAVVWTAISNELTKIFEGPVDLLGSKLKTWNELGGRASLIDGLANSIKALHIVLSPIGEAFKSAFPDNMITSLLVMSNNVKSFGKNAINSALGAAREFRNFGTGPLKLVSDMAKGLFDFIRLNIAVIKDTLYILSPLSELLKVLAQTVVRLLSKTGLLSSSLEDWYTKSSSMRNVVEKLHDAVQFLVDKIIDLSGILSAVLAPIINYISSSIISVKEFISTMANTKDIVKAWDEMFSKFKEMSGSDVLDKIGELGSRAIGKLREAVENACNYVKLLFDVIFNAKIPDDAISQPLVDGIGGALLKAAEKASAAWEKLKGIYSEILDGFMNFMSKVKPSDIAMFTTSIGTLFMGGGLIAATKGLKNFSVALQNAAQGNLPGSFINNIISNFLSPITNFFRGAGDNLNSVTKSITDTLDGIKQGVDRFKKGETIKNIKSIATSIAILAGALYVIAQIPAGKLTDAVGSILLLMGSLATVATAMKQGMGDTGFSSNVAKTLLGMASSVLILSVALKKIGSIDSDKLLGSVEALSLIMLEMAAIAIAFNKLNVVDMPKVAGMMIGMATAILMISGALSLLSLLNPDKLSKAVESVALLMGEMTMACVAVSNYGDTKRMLGAGAAIIMLAFAIQMISVPLAALALIPYEQLENSLSTLTKAMAMIILALLSIVEISKKNSVGKTAGAAGIIIMLAIALQMLTVPIIALSLIPFKRMGDALLVLTGAMIVLIGALQAVVQIGGQGGLAKAAGAAGVLMMLALALQMMAVPITMLSAINFESMMASLLGLAIAFSLLLVAMVAIQKIGTAGAAGAAGVLMLLAIAVALMVPPIMALAQVPFSALMGSLLGIAAALGILIGAMAIIGTASGLFIAGGAILAGTLILLAVAFGLVAKSTLDLGKGFALIAAGMASLAAIAPMADIAMQTLGNAIKTVIISVTSVIGVIAEGLVKGFVTMIENLGMMAPQLIGAVMKIIVELVRQLHDTLPMIVQLALETMTMILEHLVEFVPRIIELAMQLITDLLTALAAHAQDFAEKGIELITNFIEGISAKLPDLIQAANDLIISFINGLADGIRNNAEEVKAAIDNLCDAILDAFKTFFGIHSPSKVMEDQGSYLIQGLTNGVTNFNSDAVTAVTNVGMNIWNGINNTLSNSMAIGKDFLSSITSGIRLMIGDAVSAVAWAGRKIYDTMSNAVGNAANIGANFMIGLKNGLSSHLGDVLGKVAELGGNIVAKFKEMLGIHSPSRVMAEQGMYIDLGIAKGIDDNANAVRSSVIYLGKETMKAMQEALYNLVDEDEQPVIRPVLDLSDVKKSARHIGAIFGDSYAIAGSLSSGFGYNQNGIINSKSGNGGVVNNYTQNNYSPMALSRADIYRDTKSLLSLSKGVVGNR